MVPAAMPLPAAIPSRFRAWRWLLLPPAAVALAIAGERLVLSPRAPTAAEQSLPAPGYGPANFAAALAANAAQADAANERLRAAPADWLPAESASRAAIGRFRLTGDFAQLARARDLLDHAVAEAPPGAGPLLSQAVAAMMTHRLAATEAPLAVLARSAVEPEADELSEAEALRADVAFYRGDIPRARGGYASAARYGDNPGLAFRRALLAKSTGDFAGAAAEFRAAVPLAHRAAPFLVASAALQLGAVDLARGDYDGARRRFDEADRIFPGYWLFEAHRAQMQAVEGKDAAAIATLARIATVSRSPEVMDALAMLLRLAGKGADSRTWAARAGTIWAERLRLLPEAAYAHAAEHELMFGDPTRALELARANLAARPYGEAHLLLANVLLATGDAASALRETLAAEAAGWRSAQLYAARAQALELLGRGGEADAARRAATALNPRIFAPETMKVWLSHG